MDPVLVRCPLEEEDTPSHTGRKPLTANPQAVIVNAMRDFTIRTREIVFPDDAGRNGHRSMLAMAHEIAIIVEARGSSLASLLGDDDQHRWGLAFGLLGAPVGPALPVEVFKPNRGKATLQFSDAR